MKKILVLLIAFKIAGASTEQVSQEAVAQEKLEKFKKENPASYYILKKFLDHRPVSDLNYINLLDLSITMHPVSDSSLIAFATVASDHHDSALEIEKQMQATNPLIQAAVAKKIDDYATKAIDGCTKCQRNTTLAAEFRCTTYIPKDIVEAAKAEKQAQNKSAIPSCKAHLKKHTDGSTVTEELSQR